MNLQKKETLTPFKGKKGRLLRRALRFKRKIKRRSEGSNMQGNQGKRKQFGIRTVYREKILL